MSGKKNRNRNNNTSKPKEKRDEEFSPFSSIVLKEKKEEPKKSIPVKKSSSSGKRPQQIVQGYDPKASFSDILYNWEHTGELYAMPKPKASLAGARTESSQSFGDILAAWEKKSTPKAPAKGPVKRVSPEYKATKDFGSILDQYEGKTPAKPAKAKSEEPAVRKTVPAAEVRTEEKKPSNPFFREKEEDDERPSAVAWSIFGDNRKREVPPAEQPEAVGEKSAEAKPYKRSTPQYRPSEDFGAILDKYEGKAAARPDIAVPEPEPVTPAESPKSEEKAEGTTFFKSYADEERPAAVAWSVLGGNREVRRPEVKKEQPAPARREEKPPVHREEAKPSPLFQKSVSSIDVKTFDEILKEKGDSSTLRREKSINEIRMMLPQATLDLHGMTQAEAEAAVISFLDEAADSGLEKVAVIHGKGLHAEDGQGVLKELTYRLCLDSELIREYTVPKAQYGGSGALWIILKKKKSEEPQ